MKEDGSCIFSGLGLLLLAASMLLSAFILSRLWVVASEFFS